MLEIAALQESDFDVEAKSIIDSATFATGLFDAKSFVPTWMIMWSGFSLKVGWT